MEDKEMEDKEMENEVISALGARKFESSDTESNRSLAEFLIAPNKDISFRDLNKERELPGSPESSMSRSSTEDSVVLRGKVDNQWLEEVRQKNVIQEEKEEQIDQAILSKYFVFQNIEQMEEQMKTEEHRNLSSNSFFVLMKSCRKYADSIIVDPNIKGVDEVMKPFNMWMNIFQLTSKIIKNQALAREYGNQKIFCVISEIATLKIQAMSVPFQDMINGQQAYNQYFAVANIILEGLCKIPTEELTIQRIKATVNDLGNFSYLVLI
jgi:hypothetical protein